MAKRKVWWVGFSEGKPHVWKTCGHDGAYEEEVISASRNRRRVNYEDVRPCYIVEKRRTKGGKRGKA